MGLKSEIASASILISLVVSLSVGVSVSGIVSYSAASDSTAYNSQRKVVADSKESIYVVYVRELDSLPQVFVAESKDGGLTWKDLARVSDGSSEASRVSMAIDSEDTLHVFWTQGVGEYAQIFYSAPHDGGWTEPIQVSGGRAYSGYPSVAVDSNDNLHVVWYGFDGEFYQIFYTSLSNRTWSKPLQISSGTPDSVNPSIGIDASDRLHVVWYKRIGQHYQIFHTGFGGEWADPKVISSGGTDSLNVALAIDSDGVVHAVWDKLVDGTTQVFYSKLSDRVWSRQIQLSFGDIDAVNPTIALDRDDNILVFWQASDGGIYFRRFSGEWMSQERLTVEGRHIFPSARWGFYNDPKSLGSVDLIWTDVTDTSYSVRFIRMEVGSTTLGSEAFVIPFVVIGLLLGALLVLTLRKKGST